MIEKLKELHELPEAAGRAVMASANLGKWLSAALNDKTTCQEMKDDIQEWFSAGEPVSILVSLIIRQLEQAEKVKDAAQNVLLHRGSNASLSILRRALSQAKGDV